MENNVVFVSGKGEKQSWGGEVKIGKLLQGLVRSIDKVRKVVYLSSDPDTMAKSVTKDLRGLSIDLLIPGMMVNAHVKSILENGVMLSFLTYFTGTVDLFHLQNSYPRTNWKDKYIASQKVVCRILFIDPSSRAVGLTLNPHLVQNRAPPSRVSGGIILAPEGINGSICGTRESVEEVLAFVESDDRLKGLRLVESPVSPEEEAIHHGHSAASPLAAGEDVPFRWDHVRIKLKKEIVTLGMPTVSPIERVGKYVGPEEWNDLISDPDTVVIDVRNNYETRIGKFRGAVDPCTASFREFPTWVEEHFRLTETDDGGNPKVEANNSEQTAEKNMENQKQHMPRVAMYCTGGIRCEKATSLLLSKGFKEVFHLEGGILKYLEEVPEKESLWEGECFVFDKRVSVEHGLVQGNFKLCYGCKQPVSDADMEAPEYEHGVSCPHCFALKSDEEKERARARQRQFQRWGIIGGPDKGRRPTCKPETDSREPNQLSRSI